MCVLYSGVIWKTSGGRKEGENEHVVGGEVNLVRYLLLCLSMISIVGSCMFFSKTEQLLSWLNRYNHSKILLANCRKLGSCRLLSGSNQLGEARNERRSMFFLCEPLASAKEVHGCRSKQCLKSELLAPDVACAPH